MGQIEIKGGFKRSIKTYTLQCCRCPKKFESISPPVEGKPVYCKKCTAILTALSKLEQKLLAKDSLIDQEEKDNLVKIKEILERENSETDEGNEEFLTILTKKILKDENLKKHIFKAILHIQKKKK